MSESDCDQPISSSSPQVGEAGQAFDVELGILGTKEPPKNGSLRQRIIAYALEPDGANTGAYLSMILDNSVGVPQQVQPRNAQVPKVTAPVWEKRYSALSDDLRVRLAAYDFTSKLKMTGTPADRNTNLGDVKVERDAGIELFKRTGPAVQDVKDAAAKVVLKMRDKKQARYIESAAQADFLELVFALDLGLTGRSKLKELVIDKKYEWTFQVIDTVTSVLATPLYYVKHVLGVERPHTVQPDPGSQRVVPALPVPTHASYPSGHAAAAYAIATVLNRLLDTQHGHGEARLLTLSERIGENREVVGLHTELDSMAGKEMGVAIGNWMADQGEAANAAEFPHWAMMYAKAAKEWS